LAPPKRCAILDSARELAIRDPQALGEAQRALTDARGRPAETDSLALIARAQARLRRADDARRTIEALTAKIEALPSKNLKRVVHLVVGNIALDRGDATAAIRELTLAEALLPPQYVTPVGTQPSVWFAAACGSRIPRRQAAIGSWTRSWQ